MGAIKLNIFKIQKTFGISESLNFQSYQALVRTLSSILAASKINSIDENILTWDPNILKDVESEIQFCLNFIQPLTHLELEQINQIKNRLEKYQVKLQYKLQTIDDMSATYSILETYQSNNNPKPRLWFDLQDTLTYFTNTLNKLYSSNAVIPEVASLYKDIAEKITEKLLKAELESELLFPAIKQQLIQLKKLATPQTLAQAENLLSTILGNLILKNIHHLHKTCIVSIFQTEEIESEQIEIPNLYNEKVIETQTPDHYINLLQKSQHLLEKRLEWTKQQGINLTEELEYLAETNPREFYKHVHEILKQRQLAYLLKAQEENKKQSMFKKLIEKIKI